jgi:Putative transposase/Transposase zinc-binding domain
VHAHAERPSDAPHGSRTSHEVADVVRLSGEAFTRAHRLGPEQLRLLRDLARCRTPALGGHLDACEACGESRPSYNSCRNRHCPKCQAVRQAQWVEGRERRVLPTHHFHVVFTLPAPLRSIALRYRRLVFDMLFACAADTLLTLGRDPDRLGAQLAVTAVLHTWKRDLGWHPHVHCIVSGGGLDVPRGRWIPSSTKFLFPVLVMGDLFRGKMLAALGAAVDRGEIDLAGDDRRALFDALHRTRWVVYAKRPFGGAEHVIRYLGRYTHRVGISNARIRAVTPTGVRFGTKEGREVTLAPEEFLRRLLLHVLPRGFTKIRHFGLLAAGNVLGRLERARALLTSHSTRIALAAATVPRTTTEILIALLGFDVRVCPRCHAPAMDRRPLPLPVPPEPSDTS